MGGLSNLLRDLGKYDEAVPLYKRAIEGYAAAKAPRSRTCLQFHLHGRE